jgi:hypothetical protein
MENPSQTGIGDMAMVGGATDMERLTQSRQHFMVASSKAGSSLLSTHTFEAHDPVL